MSDTKFAQLLASNKIDPRRVLVASRQIERLTREDRTIRLTKRQAKIGDGDKKGEKETRKPHSGRPVTQRALNAALTGGTVSGPTKNRILRAVNRVLEQKKQEQVQLKALF
ncbi:hypothetical protein [Pendulispora albinea]|uniref:Uncharacterized protein n=1 Tax=Pendulispora albinea TaxID=2741071 RepID=A0ABZ2LZQ3_9BACT